MITCKKCYTQLEDGTKFCYNCGTEVVDANTPEPIPAAVFNQAPVPMPNQAPVPMPNQAPVPMPNQMPLQGQMPYPAPMPVPMNAPMQAPKIKAAKTGNGKLIPRLIIAAAAIVVIVIAAIILPKVLMKESKLNLALYQKDGEINYTSLSSIKPKELTEQLDNDAAVSSGYGNYLSYAIAFSSNGNRVFYPDRMSSNNDGITLFYKDLNKKSSEGEKIDSEIDTYKINDAGSKIYYIKGYDKNFYVSNLKDKEKLDSEVDMFYINKDGSKVIYINTDGNIYEKNGKKDVEKIDSNAMIVSVSEDLNTIYYLKNESLYIKKAGKDKEKLFSDVSSVINVYPSGEIYYLKSKDITYNLSDFVNDDKSETDANMYEPIAPNYPSYDDCKPDIPYPTEPDYYSYTDTWGYIDWDLYDSLYNDYYNAVDEYNALWNSNYDTAVGQYDQAWIEYQNAYDEYYAKQNRDIMRQSIDGVTIPVTNYVLYYYDTKEAKAVTDTYATYLNYNIDTPVIIYQNNDAAKITKVNLSEVQYYDDLYTMASNNVTDSTSVCAAVKLKATTITQEAGTSYCIADAGDFLYYLDNYDNKNYSYDLYEVKISNDKLDIPSKIDSDVNSLELSFNTGGKLVYYKDVKENSGDLYIDMKLVDSDVYTYSAYNIEGSDAMIYYVDFDYDTYTGTLKLYDVKNKKIEDDVYSYVVISKNKILYIADYNTSRSEGDLYLYNGTDKKKKIDTDVTALIPIYENGYRGDYSYLWNY